MKNEFATALNNVIEFNNLSMSELARMSGVSQPYISQIIKGDRKPSTKVIEKLAECLNIDLSLLLVKAGFVPRGGYDPEITVPGTNRDLFHLVRQAMIFEDISYKGEKLTRKELEKVETVLEVLLCSD